ncbi:MAG: hypothetical protein Q9181_006655, partial [Wetmoreana brouardii]
RKIREKRRYIGVVLHRGDTLPRRKGERRERRLGLEAREMSTLAPTQSETATTESKGTVVADKIPQITGVDGGAVVRETTKQTRTQIPDLRQQLGTIRPGYMFREANWQIGRVQEKDGRRKEVRVYKKGDRFLAWRKKTRRLKLAAEKRTLRGRGKKKTGGR